MELALESIHQPRLKKLGRSLRLKSISVEPKVAFGGRQRADVAIIRSRSSPRIFFSEESVALVEDEEAFASQI